MENQEKKQQEELKSEKEESPKQKSVFTATSSPPQQVEQPKQLPFNPHAKPFEPARMYINFGASQIAVNAKVWPAIASNRANTVPPTTSTSMGSQRYQWQEMDESTSSANTNAIINSMFSMPPSPMLPLPPPPTPNVSMSLQAHGNYDYPGYATNPPIFDADPNRRLYFRREFGPVATDQGFLDIRLRRGINIRLTLDRAILVENGQVRIAVSSDAKVSSLEHPNGRVRQIPDRVDIVAYDGFNKNDYLRFAKIWKDSISLTSHGCFLTYLVDPAGARTTSDQVNRDWNKDYCKETFYDDFKIRSQSEIDYAAAHYHYKVEEDGTETFNICGVKISQARDGLVRAICNDHFSIRTSVENRSCTLSTPHVYCTASMSESPHLFVRHNERRIHFDGANFIVRNMGHSASFDAQNFLRIH